MTPQQIETLHALQALCVYWWVSTPESLIEWIRLASPDTDGDYDDALAQEFGGDRDDVFSPEEMHDAAGRLIST